jgi:hypothetical protein
MKTIHLTYSPDGKWHWRWETGPVSGGPFSSATEAGQDIDACMEETLPVEQWDTDRIIDRIRAQRWRADMK